DIAERGEGGLPVVARVVLVEVEAFDSLPQVERDPLRQVARLVPEDRADREGHRPAAAEIRPAVDQPLADPDQALRIQLSSPTYFPGPGTTLPLPTCGRCRFASHSCRERVM